MDQQKKQLYGPTLPPGLTTNGKEKEQLQQLQPSSTTESESATAAAATSPSLPRKTYGPIIPPAASQKTYGPSMPRRQIGPSRPSMTTTTSDDRETDEEPSCDIKVPPRSRSRSPPSRESWMTEIGPQRPLKMDPLNIKARTFIQKGASNWEEGEKDVKTIEEERAIEEQVKEYNAAYRSRTLQQVYDQELKDEKLKTVEKDREERIFDWERDMNASVRRLSGKSAKELLNRSTLQDRFGSSSTSKKYL